MVQSSIKTLHFLIFFILFLIFGLTYFIRSHTKHNDIKRHVNEKELTVSVSL